jgi:hypothetical protein
MNLERNDITKEKILDFLLCRMAKWCLPDNDFQLPGSSGLLL